MNSDFQDKQQDHPDLDVQRIKREGKFSDEEARDIYARAAEIQSSTAFEDDGLTDEQFERGANRAGISDAALLQAIKEREEERARAAQQEQQHAAQKAALTKKLLTVGGVVVGFTLISLYGTQRSLGYRASKVEAASAQIDNVLERRHSLIPNLISVTKSTLENQSALIQSLSEASEAAKNAPAGDAKTAAETKLSQSISQTLGELRREAGSSKVVLVLADEMAGSENRIAVERRKYNLAAVEYNRAASAFPASLMRPILGYKASYPLLQASAEAKQTPKF